MIDFGAGAGCVGQRGRCLIGLGITAFAPKVCISACMYRVRGSASAMGLKADGCCTTSDTATRPVASCFDPSTLSSVASVANQLSNAVVL